MKRVRISIEFVEDIHGTVTREGQRHGINITEAFGSIEAIAAKAAMEVSEVIYSNFEPTPKKARRNA